MHVCLPACYLATKAINTLVDGTLKELVESVRLTDGKMGPVHKKEPSQDAVELGDDASENGAPKDAAEPKPATLDEVFAPVAKDTGSSGGKEKTKVVHTWSMRGGVQLRCTSPVLFSHLCSRCAATRGALRTTQRRTRRNKKGERSAVVCVSLTDTLLRCVCVCVCVRARARVCVWSPSVPYRHRNLSSALGAL